MARTALVVKDRRRIRKGLEAIKAGRKPKLGTRMHNRCLLCGRPKGYMRDFGICRICFREHARKGEIVGITKSSW
ncbi:MAG: 30S ribosomal protein S14 [Candidatus Abawacabacteria bacterium RIFCSPHIGHO2_01_FULL_46_8]|uniref:Small ribosomal subunit protein uS14 n=1 Tax=Candidatus Abawacabacteria bacterium RIFCSPHIGHO2_01_FULL_46_8 TaxID=1817815 RepID=A0A1F4XMI6_9BACT|nr:MAG: 30S ribosomal protein S14 [Candidatus Abawacabacteria bacterium RIFCSPHIGHO2_01_FULL_46_8]